MTGKICIVTGANSGIGLETAAALVDKGATVVLACRTATTTASALKKIESRGGSGKAVAMSLDLASQQSIRDFAGEFRSRFKRLDVLVNNAGLMLRTRQFTKDGIEMQFGVNHLGPYLLTRLLVDLMRRSAPSRIVVVSSTMHHKGEIAFDDLQAEKEYRWTTAYGQSKLANVMFTCALARRLEASGITANSLHPGVVRTNIARDLPAILKPIAAPLMYLMMSPEKGAQTSVYLASSPEVDGVSGQYFVKSRPARASARSRDRDAQERLWEVSARMTGLDA